MAVHSNAVTNQASGSWIRQGLCFLLFASSFIPFALFPTTNANSHSILARDGILAEENTFSLYSSSVSYYFLKWDTSCNTDSKTNNECGDSPHRVLHASLPSFLILLVASCHLCTIGVPLGLDYLLRTLCDNSSLFSDADLVKRNNSLYTHESQVQRHRRWWRSIQGTMSFNWKKAFDSVQRHCVYISSVTAIQGAIWISWGLYVGVISNSVIHVQTIDTQIAAIILQIGNFVAGSGTSFIMSVSVLNAMSVLVWALRSLFQVFLMLLLADLTSYGYHRLGHENRWCYRVIHSMHHQHYLPHHGFYALQYGTALDMILSNCCFFTGLLLFPNTDTVTLMLFSFFSTGLVTAGHSGLDFSKHPWLQRMFHPEYHAAHHQKFTVNYSEHFTIIDALFGTLLLPQPHSDSHTSKSQEVQHGRMGSEADVVPAVNSQSEMRMSS